MENLRRIVEHYDNYESLVTGVATFLDDLRNEARSRREKEHDFSAHEIYVRMLGLTVIIETAEAWGIDLRKMLTGAASADGDEGETLARTTA